MLKMSSRESRSRIPQYWAPRIRPVEVTADRNMFMTNWIWVARDTADMEFWSSRPSMIASAAATAASIRLCSAMGSVRVISLWLKILSENSPPCLPVLAAG